MGTKKRVGRPLMKPAEKVRLLSAYVNLKEKNLIIKKYGSLSNAVRERILPELLTA